VPDELIGKKVKCPGCTTMFIAEADDQDEAPPPPKKAPPKPPAKAPPERARPDAVTSSPRAKRRDEDEEEEEAPRPRAKRRDDDEEEERPSRRKEAVQEERPRAKRRDEDEEEEERPRRGRRDEEDDEEEERRPRRGRDRDDDDDDDDRPSRGRRDEADEDEQVRGWQKVRTGMNFVAIAWWLYMSIFGIYMLAGGILLLMGGGMIASLIGGTPPANAASGLGGMMVLGCGLIILVSLLGLTAFVLLMTGTGFCMATPKLRGQSMKGMAMTAFYLYIGFIGAYLFGVIVQQISLNMLIVGALIQMVGYLAFFVGHILWMVYMRQVCLYFRDSSLASSVMTNLIVQIVGPIVGALIVFLLALIVGFSGSGAGIIVVFIFYGLLVLGMLGVYVWYIMLVQKVRDLVEYKGT
jgi:hypothetical protein